VISGAASVVAGQPLDTLKVRMQTQDYVGKYKSVGDCFVKMIQNEGVRTNRDIL
jgi:hypothetical protein